MPATPPEPAARERRPGTLPLGRVAGTPVDLHWSVLLIVLLLTGVLTLSVLPAAAPDSSLALRVLAGAATGTAFVLGVVAHELGHVLAARLVGIRVRRVTLWVIGGASEMAGEPRRPGALAAVAAAGPLTTAAVGLSAAGLSSAVTSTGGSVLVVAALSWTAGANLLLAGFNLLPAAPLDGGRVLEALVWGVTHDRDRGRAVATTAGRFLGFALAVVGILLFLRGAVAGLWLAATGWFLSTSALAERAGTRATAAVSGRTVGEIAAPPDRLVQAGEPVDAVAADLRARPPREDALLVVGVDGEPVGLVTLGDLARAPGTTRVRDAGRPLPPDRIVAADTPLERVLAWGPLRGTGVLAVVADHGRPTGVVTTAGITRLVELGGPDGRAR